MLRIEIRNNSDDDDEDLFANNVNTNATSDDNIFGKIEQSTGTNFGDYDTKKDSENLFLLTSEETEQSQEEPEEISDTLEYVFVRMSKKRSL